MLIFSVFFADMEKTWHCGCRGAASPSLPHAATGPGHPRPAHGHPWPTCTQLVTFLMWDLPRAARGTVAPTGLLVQVWPGWVLHKGRWKDEALTFGVCRGAEARRSACFTEMQIFHHFHRWDKRTEASGSLFSRKK